MIHPALSKDLPGRTVDCLSPSEAPRRPTTEEPQRSRPQARGHSLRCPIVVYRCLERPAGPQNAPEIRQSSPRANATRLEERSPLAGMDNLGSRSAPSEATKTQEERSESSQRDLVHCGGWMLEYSGFQCEDDAKKSDHNIADTEADFVPRPSGSSDRVRKTWTTSRTASRLMAKTAILAAAPICNLVVSNYAHAHGLLLSPTSERLSGNGSCRYQAVFSSQISWLNCPDPLLLLAASMAGGSLMLSYRQLNIADEFQTRILVSSICVGMIFGLCSGRTILATILSILPWAIWAGLGSSDLLHIGRTSRMIRRAGDDGGRLADEVCEKV